MQNNTSAVGDDLDQAIKTEPEHIRTMLACRNLFNAVESTAAGLAMLGNLIECVDIDKLYKRSSYDKEAITEGVGCIVRDVANILLEYTESANRVLNDIK